VEDAAGSDGAEESIRKHEESEETGEVSRTMNGSKTTGTVENGMKPTITLKSSIKTFTIGAHTTTDDKALKTKTA